MESLFDQPQTERYKLLHGDCLQKMWQIPEQSVDMILCDLPYGTTACAWDTVIPFAPLWEHYERVLKENGVIVLTACQPFTTQLISSKIRWFKYCWVWEKPQGVDPFMAKIRPLNNCEDICVFAPSRTTYNPQMTTGKPYIQVRDKNGRQHELTGTTLRETTTINEGERYPGRILKFNQERGAHPTQKPVALFEYLIRTYTNPNELVLDNTMGSGTTVVAALNSGRRAIGIEMDAGYFEIAKSRIENMQMPLLAV